MTPEEIKAHLSTDFIGRKIHCFEQLTSTNDYAKDLAARGCLEGEVVIAESQTRGRGRLGRDWFCPPGKGLLFSLVLRPELPLSSLGLFSLISALACAKTIIQATGLQAKTKWPNDVLVGDKKVAGVLVETAGGAERIDYLIIGTGVNVNLRREELPSQLGQPTTTLSDELERGIERAPLLARLLTNLETYYKRLTSGQIPAILEEWRSFDCFLGQRVVVHTPSGLLEGCYEDVDSDGSLLLVTEDGSRHHILAGDVRLRAR